MSVAIYKSPVLFNQQSKTPKDSAYYHRRLRKTANIQNLEARTRNLLLMNFLLLIDY